MPTPNSPTLGELVRRVIPIAQRQTDEPSQLTPGWEQAWFAHSAWADLEAMFGKGRIAIARAAALGPLHQARSQNFERHAGLAVARAMAMIETSSVGISIMDEGLEMLFWPMLGAANAGQDHIARLFEAVGWSGSDWGGLRHQLESDLRALVELGWTELGASTPCPPVRFVGKRGDDPMAIGAHLPLGANGERIEIWSGAILTRLASARHPKIDLGDLGLKSSELSDLACCYAYDTGSAGFVVLHELAHAAQLWQVREPEPDGRDADLFATLPQLNQRATELDPEDRLEPMEPADVCLTVTHGFRRFLLDAQRLALLSEPEDMQGGWAYRSIGSINPIFPAHSLNEGLADACAAAVLPTVRQAVPATWLWEGPLTHSPSYTGGASLLTKIFGPSFDPLALAAAPDPTGLLLAAIERRFGPARAAEVRADLMTVNHADKRVLFADWRARWLRSS